MSDLSYYICMANGDDKEIVWVSGEIQAPPMTVEGRREAGFLLRKLQKGELLSMPQSRPMPSIGARCHELRVTEANATWRVIYRIDNDAIIVFEVFSKKDRKTPQLVIDNCKARIIKFDSL